jgi:hypothetical protein
MFIDLSMGTAAFLLVSNLQDLLTKLLANTGSEYNFNCLATRKHENTKLSDGKSSSIWHSSRWSNIWLLIDT